MHEHATDSMTDYGRHNLERGWESDSGRRGSQGRPMRSVLIGVGLAAAALGLMQARRSSQSGRDGQQLSRKRMRGGAQGTREAKQSTLITWLNDAHAMEKSIAQSLKAHATDAKQHPAIRERLRQHLDETRHHADLVKGCIENLGGSTSTLKSGMSSMMGAVQGAATMPAKDSLVKDILADSAAEQLEIASYRGIITAAEEIGDTETARVCRQILREEEQMLEWFEEQLPRMVRDQMAHA